MLFFICVLCYNLYGDGMDFKVISDGNVVNCNIVMTFKENEINYIVYTDGTKDNNGNLELYASRYIILNNEYRLTPILSDREWDMVESKIKEMSEK